MDNSKKHGRGPIDQPRFYSLLIAMTALGCSLLLAGCGIDFNNPPRLATATARSAAPPVGQAEPLILPAPTGTPGSGQAETDSSATEAIPATTPISEGDGLVLWVDETSAEHKRVLDEIAAEFSDRYGTNMAVQLVSPAILPDLVSTGVLSGTLPDLILHPIEYTTGWAESGILDAAATDEVADRLGRETFDSSALELATVDGQVAALPSDGFHQLLLYRADWFEELNLAMPDTYNAIATAAERINNPEAIISGLVIPTESNLITTHQAFEQIALANGCRLIDENGEVLLLEPECAAALEQYYTTIHQFSPSGVQTDTSVAIAYLTGRTGIIMTSPAILPDLAGLNEPAMPTCPECVAEEGGVNYLAKNTGIVTEIRGPNGEPTSFGNIRNLGITSTADRAAAQAFAEFWFNEGYERWLAVDSERKVPMRLGTQSEPRRFIDAWGILPLGESSLSLTDIYGEEVVGRLRSGIAAAPRWGIREGYGGLMTRLYDDNVISIVLQEMLSGYFDTTTTLREGYRRTIELIPNYAFPDRLAEETGEN